MPPSFSIPFWAVQLFSFHKQQFPKKLTNYVTATYEITPLSTRDSKLVFEERSNAHGIAKTEY